MNYNEFELYETMWSMWVFLEWQLNCKEELYIKGNKLLMDSELSSPDPRTFQGIMPTPCDINDNMIYLSKHPGFLTFKINCVRPVYLAD